MLPRLSLAHHDAAPAELQFFIVKGVQWLAGFEHTVVSDIHDVVDRAHTGQT